MMRNILVLIAVAGLCGGAVAEDAPALFNGKDLTNWTTEGGDPVPEAWKVVDGAIVLDRDQGRGGNIVSKYEYGEFDLSFEWKIAEAGNNGLKYRVRKYDGKSLGIEYQLLDDPNTKEGREKPKNSAGSIYDIKEPNDKKQLKPAGEWNHARIVVQKDTIQHWMNGELVATLTIGSEEWTERIENSKFKKYEAFAENQHGKIMLTDHGAKAWFRNMELKPLD